MVAYGCLLKICFQQVFKVEQKDYTFAIIKITININMENIVFIAKSLDGYIADKYGGLDWLHAIPNPENIDMGYNKLIERVDAIVMGRNTFEMVCGFDIPWPYTVPVFVLSTTLNSIPEKLSSKVELINGSPSEITKQLEEKGYNSIYIDGGKTIQSFLQDDLIDELIISTIPTLLGGGSSLFGDLKKPIEFKHINSEVYLNAIVQDTYKRVK